MTTISLCRENPERKELDAQIADYKARGGKITEYGVTIDGNLSKGSEETIRVNERKRKRMAKQAQKERDFKQQ
jgi:hypothetical protein